MTTHLETIVGHDEKGFCIYRNQLLLLVASRWAGRRWATFLIIFAILLVPRLLVTLAEGTFGPVGDIAGDLRAILLGQGSSNSDPTVPLLRDYADLAIVLLMSAHTAHMVCQWRRINALPARLRQAGLLSPCLHESSTFNAILARYESRFNSLVWEFGAMAIASIGAVLLAVVACASGIYRGLGSSAPAMDHFTQWWANPQSHPLAFAVVVVSYWLYLYLVARHSFMGILAVGLLMSARHTADQHRESWLGYSSPWDTSEETVLEMRGVLDDIMVSITLLVSVFLIANLYMSLPEWLQYGFVLPYVFLNPIFLVAPSIELNHRLDASWRRLHDAAVEQLGSAVEEVKKAKRGNAEAARVQLDACRDTLDRVSSLPRLVIDWRYLAKAVLVYFVPAFALVPALLGSHP